MITRARHFVDVTASGAGLTLLALALLLAAGCATSRPPAVVVETTSVPPRETTPTPTLTPTPTPEPLATPTPSPESAGRPLAVVNESIAVSAWTEPRRLPPGGGQAQVIVRVLRHNGRPLPGVEVRVATSAGSLYSQGKILTTDARGIVRDSLTTTRATTLTIQAGGQEQHIELPLGEAVVGD
jgi:hypothetical protein